MNDAEEQLTKNLRTLDLHYDKFNFDNYKFFISFFEQKESSSLASKEYSKIAEKYNHEVFTINNTDELKELLVKPVSKQYYIEQAEKFFKDKTFIVDIDNEEILPMMKELINLAHHFVKRTQITLHFLCKSEHVRDYFAGSDFWEFRTQTFDYSALDEKIKFKQMIETALEDKPTQTKKQKI